MSLLFVLTAFNVINAGGNLVAPDVGFVLPSRV